MGALHKVKTAVVLLRDEGISGITTVVHEKFSLRWERFFHKVRGFLFRVHILRVRPGCLPRILFIVNTPELQGGQTVRYRVFNIMEALDGKAEVSMAVLESGICLDDWQIAQADLIVLMRVFHIPELDLLFDKTEKMRIPTVFDIDDLIFLSEYYPGFCTTLNIQDEEEKKLYAEWFAKFHTIFHRCTFSTASTPFIAEKMSALKKAFVIHNGLNKEQLAIAEKLQVKKEPYSICYLSGSKSHDRDFAQVQPAIERIMEENDAVHFYVAGYLNESLSNRFADRIVRLPYMPWQKLLAFNAKMSVNLAPLDTENPFCHAKSELKYFEAALVGVPTVASPTDTFVKCIRSGENGFLAESEEEWYQAIHTLLEDQKLAIRMSDLAKQDVLERYAPQAIGKEAFAVYQNILKEAKTVFKK